jgi:hypothetical protein
MSDTQTAAQRYKALYEAACTTIEGLEGRHLRALRALAEIRASGTNWYADGNEGACEAYEAFLGDLDTPDTNLLNQLLDAARRRKRQPR